MCQDIEVHLIVRTRQWLSQGEERLRLGGPECCSHQFLLVTRKRASLQGAPSVWAQETFRWASFRLGSSNPRCCQSPMASAGTWAGPSDLPPEHFSSTSTCCPWMLWYLCRRNQNTMAAETENDQELMTSKSTEWGHRVPCKISYGLWMLWCTSRNVSPVRQELMMLEKILHGKISA